MLKTIAKCIREYKKPSILAPAFVMLEVIIECIIPFLTAGLINEIENGCGLETIVKYGSLLVVMAALSLTCGVLSGHYCAIASCGFAKNLRRDMFYRVQDFSFANIDKFSTSSLLTRLTTDVSNVQMSYMMIIRTAVRCPFMLISAFVMSIMLGGKLAFIFAIIVPILGFGLFYIIKLAFPLFRKVFKKYDRLNESVQENIAGIRVVKSFVREDFENKKFENTSRDVANDFTKAEKLIALNTPLMQFCIYMVMLLISFFCSKLVVSTNALNVGVGTLSGMLTYAMQIMMSMMMVSVIFVMVTLSVESARRITEVLNEESVLKNPENPIYDVKDGTIEFRNVNFKYSEEAEKMSLTNINVKIGSGMTVGVIGSTGSSKTTFVNLISRLYDVTDGQILVGGVDVRDYDLQSLRNNVAVVLQKNVLFSGTIKENLRWGDPNATDEDIVRVCKLAMADEFVSQFPEKYDTYIEQGGTNVSGGQKQRLCIARALLKKPKIIILDDSTSAVDTKTEAMINLAFKSEIPDTTKIIIAQRISSIQNADMIIVLEDGKINGVGTHAELLETNEIYKDVFTSQTKGAE